MLFQHTSSINRQLFGEEEGDEGELDDAEKMGENGTGVRGTCSCSYILTIHASDGNSNIAKGSAGVQTCPRRSTDSRPWPSSRPNGLRKGKCSAPIIPPPTPFFFCKSTRPNSNCHTFRFSSTTLKTFSAWGTCGEHENGLSL